MTRYEQRLLALCINKVGDRLYSENATTVFLDDDGAGEFILVNGEGDEVGVISIDPEQWPKLRDAIDSLVELARSRNYPVTAEQPE